MCAMACMWKQKTAHGTWSFVLSGIKCKQSFNGRHHLPTESSTGGLFILMTVVLERVLLSGVGLKIIL